MRTEHQSRSLNANKQISIENQTESNAEVFALNASKQISIENQTESNAEVFALNSSKTIQSGLETGQHKKAKKHLH